MGIFSAPRREQPKPTPVTPRLSDVELKAKSGADETRKRMGMDDQILSLGRIGSGTGDRPMRATSLLGRAGQ